MEDAAADPAILIDLLQAMVSQTHWVYAELWVPRAGRLRTEAVWWRPGKGGDSFERLERMSRAMAMKPGSDLAGRVWGSGEPQWVVDMSSKGSPLHDSPRQDAIQNAGIMSALSAPAKTDSGECVAIIVLMSQRVEQVNESKLQSVQALCSSAAPFLEHLAANSNSKGENSPPNNQPRPLDPLPMMEGRRDSVASHASNLDISADPDKAKISRLTIKYPAPSRGNYRSLGAETANPGATPLRHATHSVGMHTDRSQKPDPRGQQRGSAMNYLTQLVTALQKCAKHEDGKPDAIRTNVAWVVLEQMAADVGAYSECLTMLIDELRPALFGDDLIAMDDGMSMVKAPFFTQLAYREQQVRNMEAKVQQTLAESTKVQSELESVKTELADLKANKAQMLRKVFLAERRLIKLKLTTFLEHRGMQLQVHQEKASEIKSLKDEIADLSTKLGIKLESGTNEMISNEEERQYLSFSVQETGILRPPMKASLMEPPTIDPTVFGPWKHPLPQEDEATELKEQLLILRNAMLTEYEKIYAATDHETRMQPYSDEKCKFVTMMDELETELRTLEGSIEGGWLTPRYELEDTDKAKTSPPGSPLSSSRNVDVEQDEEEVEEEEGDGGFDEEEQRLFWTDKGSNAVAINIWKSYEKRVQGRARDLPRVLPDESITQWVYEIFEEKVRLDIDSQTNKTSAGYMTIEKVFYKVLDEKYGSELVANLVAFDFLSYIDANRENVKLYNLFAGAMSGGWYDADWKYILRVQQFIKALAPMGFPHMLALDEFMVKHFYHDQPQSEIHRVLKAFTVFPPYNRQLAESDSEAISAELFAEFIAFLLDIQEEPRVRKVSIMSGITSMDKPIAVSYDQFEKFANMCVPLPLKAEIPRLYYRMMIRAHPDELFPPPSLAMAITAIELEVLLDHYSLEVMSLSFADRDDAMGPMIPRLPSIGSQASHDSRKGLLRTSRADSPMSPLRSSRLAPSSKSSPLQQGMPGRASPQATLMSPRDSRPMNARDPGPVSKIGRGRGEGGARIGGGSPPVLGQRTSLISKGRVLS